MTGDEGDDDDILFARRIARGVASKKCTLLPFFGVVSGEAGGQKSSDLDAGTCSLEERVGGT